MYRTSWKLLIHIAVVQSNYVWEQIGLQNPNGHHMVPIESKQ